MWKRSWRRVVLTGLLTISAQAVILGQIDDFNDNTTQNWQRGNVALGGPGGALDPFLQLTADGSIGPNGKLVTFNQAQWSGDYTSAGVGSLFMFLNNNGAADLFVRIAIGDDVAPATGGTWLRNHGSRAAHRVGLGTGDLFAGRG